MKAMLLSIAVVLLAGCQLAQERQHGGDPPTGGFRADLDKIIKNIATKRCRDDGVDNDELTYGNDLLVGGYYVQDGEIIDAILDIDMDSVIVDVGSQTVTMNITFSDQPTAPLGNYQLFLPLTPYVVLTNSNTPVPSQPTPVKVAFTQPTQSYQPRQTIKIETQSGDAPAGLTTLWIASPISGPSPQAVQVSDADATAAFNCTNLASITVSVFAPEGSFNGSVKIGPGTQPVIVLSPE
ncbi:hypothetical protein [Pseudomarimonas arenosa]|uniref:Ig-like domain-containing protein n=1 Tax=Pseudomarimonas arenosa TaxID=2774145 RepID=A0AAW3ZNQ4_9GAMM|nr:hypothetical protein [Pseudomarimonas arenosa]MBD8525971.1 hypothetical protein [Pseudomarimonas arenosa]